MLKTWEPKAWVIVGMTHMEVRHIDLHCGGDGEYFFYDTEYKMTAVSKERCFKDKEECIGEAKNILSERINKIKKNINELEKGLTA